ncbi:hypothetical protein H6G92_16925 [Nostoc foliaceum FACHB-393]|uniref:Uncharacterized protein n=1 Tax=Nostoc foliaceum FACHB-393 TaxID=2692915 RepID=A0ABR8I8E2_9NOSO|nr:hypothetical protein [Nostoc foliaceum FACHB-393]
MRKSVMFLMQADALIRQADALIRQADALTMQADALTMQADALTMQADALTMQADALTMQPDALTMQADALTRQADAYSASRLNAIHFDLSPNLSPKRREALRLTPLTLQGRGWGLSLYFTQLRTAILSGIAKLNSLRINEMLYLAQNLVNHPVCLGSITAAK